jgi:hypothetical protein
MRSDLLANDYASIHITPCRKAESPDAPLACQYLPEKAKLTPQGRCIYSQSIQELRDVQKMQKSIGSVFIAAIASLYMGSAHALPVDVQLSPQQMSAYCATGGKAAINLTLPNGENVQGSINCSSNGLTTDTNLTATNLTAPTLNTTGQSCPYSGLSAPQAAMQIFRQADSNSMRTLSP